MMMKQAIFLYLSIVLFSGVCRAEIYEYYFDGVVPANGIQPNDEEIAVALQQVMWRIGNVSPDTQDPHYLDLISSASNLVKRFRITTLPDSTQDYFVIEFDVSVLQEYLRDSNLRTWDIERPKILWIEAGFEVDGNLWMLDNESSISERGKEKALFRQYLNDLSIKRGIILNLPIWDFEDRAQIEILAKTGDYQKVAEYFKFKYNQDGVVIGWKEIISSDKLVEKWYHSGYYSGAMYESESSHDINNLSVSLKTVQSKVFMSVADIYFDVNAQQHKGTSTATLIVAGVVDVFAFREVTNTIYSIYDSVNIVGLRYGELEFEVRSSLGIAWIRNILEKTQKFEPITLSSSGSVNPQIAYRFLQQ